LNAITATWIVSTAKAKGGEQVRSHRGVFAVPAPASRRMALLPGSRQMTDRSLLAGLKRPPRHEIATVQADVLVKEDRACVLESLQIPKAKDI